jgi:uncharacterized Zn-binding protein involved in type VI secretion
MARLPDQIRNRHHSPGRTADPSDGSVRSGQASGIPVIIINRKRSMGLPAAKQGDQVVGTDTHIVMVPAGTSLTPTPLPHPFSGQLGGGLSSDVKIEGKAAATVGSTADNSPPHVPTAPGTGFQKPPSNRATIRFGSATVKINGKAAARAGDKADTCNDPADLPVGQVVATGTVLIG